MRCTATRATFLASLLAPALLAMGGCEDASSAIPTASGPQADHAATASASGSSDAAPVADPVAGGVAEPRDEGTPSEPPAGDGAATAASAASAATGSATADPPAITDAAIAPWRLELLEDAFRVATRLPSPLHEKDRARAQQAVVTAMLELDQPIRVAGFINQIPGWRRGDAFADLAFHRAERGDRRDAAGFLGLAERIAETTEDWRRDRIRVNVARTHALLGRDAVAQGMETDVVPSETGVVDAVRARILADERFDEQLDVFARTVAIGDFDLTRNVLAACVELYGRFYDMPERRERIHRFIVASWSALPVDIRVHRLMDLADIALARGDEGVARSIVDEARTMLEGVRMTAEGWVPLSAAVARRRAAVGDAGRARSALDEALARYEAERRTIIDMFRADVLRPVAEAFVAIGDEAEARRVYGLALDEGAANPNARPRARDLSATLASMAVAGLQPDAALAARIAEIDGGLGAPW